VQLNGRRVEVDVAGEGRPIVLIHSLLTDAAAFDLVVPHLARGRRVFRVSLPGFGRSSPLQQHHPTIEDLADLLAETMMELGLGSDAAVLGNGLGGFAAVALAIRHGDRFGPLIAANCGAVFTPERREAFGTMSRLVEEGGMEAVVDVAVSRVFPPYYLDRHPEVIDRLRRVLMEVEPGSFSVASRALAAMDLRPGLSSIRNPTLVVVGADDLTTPPEMAGELTAGIPGARCVILSECGHCPQLQQPEALLEAVESFLGS